MSPAGTGGRGHSVNLPVFGSILPKNIRLSSVYLPLATPISDAKVLTGRQKPMTEIAILFAEIETEGGDKGLGFSYAKRAGGRRGRTAAELRQVVRDGKPGTLMAPFAGALSDAEIDAVVAFLQSFRPAGR